MDDVDGFAKWQQNYKAHLNVVHQKFKCNDSKIVLVQVKKKHVMLIVLKENLNTCVSFTKT